MLRALVAYKAVIDSATAYAALATSSPLVVAKQVTAIEGVLLKSKMQKNIKNCLCIGHWRIKIYPDYTTMELLANYLPFGLFLAKKVALFENRAMGPKDSGKLFGSVQRCTSSSARGRKRMA